MQHMTSLILPLAQQHNLSLNAFGSQLTSDSNRTSGAIVISDAYDSAVEPSPISPIDSEPYKLLSGTIKATYEARCNDTAGATNKPLKMIVAPGLAAGNTGRFPHHTHKQIEECRQVTDTRWYWNLTQNIFRYNYATIDGAYGEIHTVNEGQLENCTIPILGITQTYHCVLCSNQSNDVRRWDSLFYVPYFECRRIGQLMRPKVRLRGCAAPAV